MYFTQFQTLTLLLLGAHMAPNSLISSQVKIGTDTLYLVLEVLILGTFATDTWYLRY